MLVVTVELYPGGNAAKRKTLGTMVVDNIGVSAEGRRGNYRVRVYKKGEDLLAFRYGKAPLRQGQVLDHARLSLPVWSLVAKALKAVGYSR